MHLKLHLCMYACVRESKTARENTWKAFSSRCRFKGKREREREKESERTREREREKERKGESWCVSVDHQQEFSVHSL